MKKHVIPETGKDKTYWDILNAAIYLDIKTGHLKWTYAQLSRKSGVTRSLIYYYFGKSKLVILEESCRLFGDILSGTNNEYMNLWKKNDYVEPLKISRDIFSKFEMLMPFYFINRNLNNTIGKLIRENEEKGIEKRKKYFPHLSKSQCRALFALQMGISTYLGLEEQDIEVATQMISIPRK